MAKNSKLLSGGNPQIKKADGDAPVQEYIQALQGWKKEVTKNVDALIVKAVPKVEKAVKWNSPFYGVKGKGWFINIHAFTKYVKVTFFNGGSLKPLPPGESKYAHIRHINIFEDDPDFDEKQFSAWVKQSSKLPGWDGAGNT